MTNLGAMPQAIEVRQPGLGAGNRLTVDKTGRPLIDFDNRCS
jgi:hypothetical protein